MSLPKKENDYCLFFLDEKGIVHEIFKNSFELLNLQIAKEITADRIEICAGVSRPLYVELGKALKMDKDANKYLSTGEAMTFLTATAILVRDRIEKLGASIYIRLFKPEVPTKFFTKKDEALKWLEQYTVEKQN